MSKSEYVYKEIVNYCAKENLSAIFSENYVNWGEVLYYYMSCCHCGVVPVSHSFFTEGFNTRSKRYGRWRYFSTPIYPRKTLIYERIRQHFINNLN